MTDRPGQPIRIRSRGGPALWLLPGALAIEVVAVTRASDFPNGSGVPFAAVWLLATGAGLSAATLAVARFRPARPALRPVEALALMAVLAMVLTDVTMAWQPLRDLGIYLRAGQHFLDGSAVYAQTPLTVQPEDRTAYPFLYPPCTLPLFGALALLPLQLAQSIWAVGSLALGLLALRLFGLPWRWLVPIVLWPPFFQGLWVGNVALPALVLFGLGPWLGAGLVLAAIFKSYTGIAAVWLVRERRWAQAVAGVAVAAVLMGATVPLTGTGAWSDWLNSLQVYQTSQRLLPGLYGFGLPRFIPFPAYLALAVVAVLAALRVRGRESLARFGTATVVAGSSLFGHGLLMAVPSLVSLRSPWLWLAAGLLSTPDGAQWWLAVGVIAASWVVPSMRRDPLAAPPEADQLHPLGTGLLWPDRNSRLRHRQVQDGGLGERVGVPAEGPADGLDPDRPIA